MLHALSRANHIEDGTTAESREITKARNHLNSALSKYSSSSLLTAFQKSVDIGYAERQVIGAYTLKKGRVMHEAESSESLPPPSRLTPGKDFGHVVSTGEYKGVINTGGRNVWFTPTAGNTPEEKLLALGCCDYVPDVVVPDMERVMSCLYRRKGEDGPFSKMDFVPLVDFFADGSKYIYNASPFGENKVELRLQSGLEQYDFKVVYYTKMSLKDDDYIELPDAYKELLTLAVTVGLLSEDADSDPKQLANYSAQLTSMEDLIGSTNVTTRRLTREPGTSDNPLYSGAFIRRRFR